MKQILSVPKSEMTKREAAYQQERAAKVASRKSKLQGLIMLGVLVPMLVGCTPLQNAPEEQRHSATSFQPRPGYAALYFYRPAGIIAAGGVYPAHVDGRILGNNGSGTFLFTEIPPGHHTVAGTIAQASFDAEPGKAYFVKQTVGIAETYVHMVAEEEGRVGVSKCKQIAANF